MKFGKRLLAEAARSPACGHAFIDYRQLKHAIKLDVAARDARGAQFERALRHELQKVAAFFLEKEEELAAAMGRLSHASQPQEVASLRGELQELRRFVALNYIAVVKAAKKRNRHLRAACGGAAVVAPLRAASVLTHQYFFTSGTLAALTTQAEILAQELSGGAQPVSEVLRDYQCPICLDLLRSPVVLTCAHRFCWGCLLAHCTAVQSGGGAPGGGKAAKQLQQAAEAQQPQGSSSSTTTTLAEQQQQQEQAAQQDKQEQREPGSPVSVLAVWEGEHSDDEAACCTFDCAVCRKAQLLNLDRLQVDPHLEAFLHKLERMQQRSSSQPIAIGGGGGAAAASSAAGDMLVEPRPASKAASLAEASELAEATSQAAAAGPAEAAAAAQAAAAAAAAPRAEVLVQAASAPFAGEAPLLPPQRAEHAGRLVVCLDLDGTLVTTFTPKRAPLLPPGMVSYVVGRGGKLNPGGVFVVERPGLGDFLHRIGAFAEVVLFTAGLEDYAAPICDAIEARYPGCFHHRLYRPATVASDVYPCIKDMTRLGRHLARCVLVDDTPLAFFRQPDHGIPVLQFRGDSDDRMLTEAVAPLLEQLQGAPDVAPPLTRRFDMQKWFQAQGLAPPLRPCMQRNASLPQLKQAAAPSQLRSAVQPAPRLQADATSAELLRQSASADTLLLCDFDKTLVEWDAGERLCDELAPELTSLLSSLQMPANFVPVTNTVLSEMQRRGVSRDRLVAALREMGREVPMGSVRMLQWAARRGMDAVILSDCNSLFISHILTGARLNGCVRHVITNPATFERAPAPGAGGPAAPDAAKPAASGGWSFFRSAAPPAAARPPAGASAAPPTSHKLVIRPRHDHAVCGSHGCPLCPANLCKGRELAALRAANPYRRIIYCGDGANDLCPALLLGPQDLVLARAGHALERLIGERAASAGAAADGRGTVAAAVHTWRTHEELFRLVQQHAV